jgi:GxxExxY protein
MVRRAGNGTDEALNELSKRILGAAFHVHTRLGPGLLESAYEACLDHELRRRGLAVERQKTLPVRYDDVLVDAGYRIHLLVESAIIIEVKSVRQFAPIHDAQVLTYLKLSGLHLGLLLNFNVVRLKQGGIKRLVDHFPER